MSAHVDYIDREKRVVWISFLGRGDGLKVDLQSNAVDYVPSFYLGRIGLTYCRALPEDRGEIGRFSRAAVELVEVLTARSGITREMRDKFISSLHEIQTAQGSMTEAAS